MDFYTDAEVKDILNYYFKCGSVTDTVRYFGRPTRTTLYRWLKEDPYYRERVSENRHKKRKQSPKKIYSLEFKLEAIARCKEEGVTIKSVADSINVDPGTVADWCRKYNREGVNGLMKKSKISNIKSGTEPIQNYESMDELKARIHELELDNDVLRETINVLKKDPSINQVRLTSAEKVAIIDALKEKYSLPELFNKLSISKSTYYYQKKHRGYDKYANVRELIRNIFVESKMSYGYRRIWAILRTVKHQVFLSEKVVRRIMTEENLVAKRKKIRKYNSYLGELTPAEPNIVARNFHADKPNKVWLTDITEFAIPAGKIYFSPIVDCFDGLIVSWSIGTNPNAELVNTMLDKAIKTLSADEKPIIHTDRGAHYRWPGWISRMENAKLTRSMSKKGCCPDNAACEGVFGRIKNEMFYNTDWRNISIYEFMTILDDYIKWYNSSRIKRNLGYLSPIQYRQKLGLKMS